MDAGTVNAISVQACKRLAAEREERQRAAAQRAHELGAAFGEAIVVRCAELAARTGERHWMSPSFSVAEHDDRFVEWRDAAPDNDRIAPYAPPTTIWRPIVNGAMELLRQRRFGVQLVPQRVALVYICVTWDAAAS